MPDVTVDARGLKCPLPILKAKKALKDLPPAGVLEILATDPGSPPDFEAFCRTTGYVLAEHSVAHGVHRFLIRRPPA